MKLIACVQLRHPSHHTYIDIELTVQHWVIVDIYLVTVCQIMSKSQANFSQSNTLKRKKILDLRSHLQSFATCKDLKQKKDVVKKVLEYMTSGIDVSCLFKDVVAITAHESDSGLKNMLHLYISTYVEANHPTIKQSGIHILQCDFRDDDPRIRAMALRSICSLRIPNRMEYAIIAIQRGLDDDSVIVRKAAVGRLLRLLQPYMKDCCLNLVVNNSAATLTFNDTIVTDPDFKYDNAQQGFDAGLKLITSSMKQWQEMIQNNT